MESTLGGHSDSHNSIDNSPPFPAEPLPRQDTPRHGTPQASSSFRPILTKFPDGDGATWSEFLHFYSRGAWDPQKVPVMPKWSPRAPGAKPLLSNPSAPTQTPEFSTEGSSETIHHAPLTFDELASSQLETCSLPPQPSLCTQSVLPQGDNFESLGYLAAPFAPHELDRRRALYRFNVLHSTKDPNFDRLVQLTKLVFGTKIALIALVDDDEQWFKAESGLGRDRTDRHLSFCAHTILQPNSEPLVVFDTNQDWRFRNNPLVTGPPQIRFYAGAPLRTNSGFNIGSLCIIDDQPRIDFSSREKHQLKELAAIVMRELELFRDKMRLKVKDRMQESLEQFTRECLEMDPGGTLGIDPEGNSMDRVYDKAVSLAKRTLSVDGALVVDISSFHTAEKTHSKDLMTATVYHSEKLGRQDARLQASLSEGDYDNVDNFFKRFPDGHIYHDRFPLPFMRHVLPQRTQYALVPVYHGTGQLPFALLCVYTQQPKRFLERFDLLYLRAIGVVLLSAVIKRKMQIADRAKTLFISNISHELRTPLHGILAAAELLDNGSLDSMQSAYLHSIRSCGQSLAETVNHVLEFQKLSGAAVDAIATSPVDLLQLVEEAAECGWMGAKAMYEAAVGLAGDTLSPAQEDAGAPTKVELVIDIEHSGEGWDFRCEKNGLRRILLNVLSNAIKFTDNGYIHVSVRRTGDGLCLLTVIDSGKGMSAEFIQNGLFRPFSQEDPLRNGTGLGLAIVKAISDRMSGDLRISSVEGDGTRVSLGFPVEPITKAPKPIFPPIPFKSAILYGYNESHRGSTLLKAVTTRYLTEWWGVRVLKPEEESHTDLIIINESLALFRSWVQRRQIQQPVVLLISTRRDLDVCKSSIAEFENSGGVCEVMFKPSGPVRLHCALMRAAQKHAQTQLQENAPRDSGVPLSDMLDHIDDPITKSELQDEEPSKFRVLCVEDNPMLRRMLVRWLQSNGIAYGEASDGLEAVEFFEQRPPNYFDVLLMDVSMPRLDGVGATKQIRDIEASRNATNPDRPSRVKIVALTGMSTADDKKRAFEAGVDDYFVKPVPLNALFAQIRN